MLLKKLVPMALLAASLSSGGLALAGYKATYPVTVSVAYRYAYGSMGSARNSLDGNQILNCYLQAGTSQAGASFAPQATCTAEDANGNSAYCSTTEASFVDAVRMMVTGDSYISFGWNANGVCNGIQVYNASYFEPKK
jgi:hypothetical protein